LLSIIQFPIVNKIKERTLLRTGKDWNVINNRFEDLTVTSNIIPLQKNNSKTNKSNNNLNDLINKVQNFNLKSNKKIHSFLFNSIKYKNLAGMRIKLNGRLTKRYRADRALHILKWKGGLKNIESSFKRLSSVLYRGNTNSNNAYSLAKGKRRIGSFALKGWISGK
jgi:hypothetical protein